MARSIFPALKKDLLRQLGDCLQEFGFDRRAKRQAFYRFVAFGKWGVHLSFIDHDNDFDMTVDVAIRVDAVERMVNAHNRLLSPDEKESTFTIGCELGNLADGRQRRWTLSDTGNVSEVSQQICREFQSFGLPYLEKYSELDVMLQAISGSGPESWLHAPIHDARYMRAVGLAILIGRSDAARNLVVEGESFLRQRSDPALPAFEAFAQSLGLP